MLPGCKFDFLFFRIFKKNVNPMAKQTGILPFTGKLGNLIGYRRNGSYFVRSMPEEVRQTTATRQSSRNFGIASRTGKLIRQAITPQLSIGRDGTLVNRLNKALIQGRLQQLEGFRFNRHTGVDKFFSRLPVLSSGGALMIPAQTWPPSTAGDKLEISVIAVRINPVTRQITGSHTATLLADLDQPFNGAALEATTPGKGTLLVTLQARIFNGTIPTLNRRFMAADIIAVVLPAIKQKSRKGNRLAGVKQVLPHHLHAGNNVQVTTNSTPDQVHLYSGSSPTFRPVPGHSGVDAPPPIAILF